jgi:hypothetical protein
VVRSRGKRVRQSAAKSLACYNEDDHGENHLAAIVNVIGYLRRFQNLTTAEARFSGEFADADSFKENLAVVQLATKTLQHAYGIIATSTTAIHDPAHQHTAAPARQTITRRKWSIEDERRLVEMRDCQRLSWSSIRDSFPGRTLDAVRQRYVRKTSKKVESSSSKENHSALPSRHATLISGTRRSQRLARTNQAAGTKNDAGRHRRYHLRATKHPHKQNALETDFIDPLLRDTI